jgi:hypothetical protein
VLYIFSDGKEARKSFQLNIVTINYKKKSKKIPAKKLKSKDKGFMDI